MRASFFFCAMMILFFLPKGNLQAQKQSGNKHGLIITIGEYAPGVGWDNINSNNDLPYIKKALENQRFPSGNIQTLSNQAATRSGISRALKDLTSKVKQGDVVAIHISSHGSQIEDDNDDETDNLDEAIVPYDAPSSRASKDFKKDKEKYFRDDEFGDLINELRLKLGKEGDVLVSIDACHSGSGTRGMAKTRGGLPPLVSKDFDMQKAGSKKENGVFREGSAAELDESSMATYVVISAARAAELNWETYDDNYNPMGSLSYSISKVFENLDSNTTYRNLFANMLIVMNQKVPSQQPVLEGNGLDRKVFGGDIVVQKPYLELKKIDGNKITVNGGKLSGMDEGAKVGLYPSITVDPSNATLLTAGKVISTSLYESTIQLEKPLDDTLTAKYRAFVTETVFKIDPVKLDIITSRNLPVKDFATVFFTDAEVQATKTLFKDDPLVEFSSKPELALRKGNGKDELVIMSNGYVFKSFDNSKDYAPDLKKAIRGYAQYKVLLREVKSENYHVEVKLIPLVNGEPDSMEIAKKLNGGVLEFKEGESAMVWVRNNGDFPVYINILDLQPDGKINPILPYKKRRIYPADLKIEPRSTRLIRNKITFSPPFGTEVFKVFISTDEIDLEQISESNGSTARGNFNTFEKLVRDSYTKPRGGDVSVSESDGMTMSIQFNIIKK